MTLFITELVKSSMVGGEDTDTDNLNFVLYSNGLDELVTRSTLSEIMQGSP